MRTPGTCCTLQRLAAAIVGSFLLASCGGGTQQGGATGAPGSVPGISLLAGKTGRIVDGIGPDASFGDVSGLGLDAAGNIYVFDFNVVRKINPNTGATTTIAGDPAAPGVDDGVGRQAHFDYLYPSSFAVSSTGVAWRFENALRRIAQDGVVTSIAFDTSNYLVDSGAAADRAGNVYFTRHRRAPLVHGLPFDARSEILQVSPSGTVTTIASTDHDWAYRSLASGPDGELYIISPDKQIQRVDAGGTAVPVHSLPAFGQFPHSGLARDTAGNFFVTNDTTAIWKVQPDGSTPVFAGTEATADIRDGKGSDAAFHRTGPLTIDAKDTLYVGDSGTVRRIAPDGTVTTIAGRPFWADGKGGAARIQYPEAVTADGNGNVYVVDSCRRFVSCVRKVDAQGNVTTIVAAGSDSISIGTRFSALAAGAAGNVYTLADQAIFRITATRELAVFAGAPGAYGSVDAVGTAARFSNPTHAAADGAGNLYVVDGSTIRKLSPQGSVTTLAGQPNESRVADGRGSQARFQAPQAIAVGPDDTLYLLDGDSVRTVTSDGTVTTLAGTAGKFAWAKAIAIDTDKTIYLVRRTQRDGIGGTIEKLAPDGTVATVAGTLGEYGVAEGSLPGKVGTPTGISRIAAKTFAFASPGGVFRIVLP